MDWIVFPSPISSAKMHDLRLYQFQSSQLTPSSWYARSFNTDPFSSSSVSLSGSSVSSSPSSLATGLSTFETPNIGDLFIFLKLRGCGCSSFDISSTSSGDGASCRSQKSSTSFTKSCLMSIQYSHVASVSWRPFHLTMYRTLSSRSHSSSFISTSVSEASCPLAVSASLLLPSSSPSPRSPFSHFSSFSSCFSRSLSASRSARRFSAR
mmetsp:Transcript_25239/g.53736  ORF Transcript_25239/g.53736 Transcript_25239/m.53736 type:complete len:209 (+) Transcript_25239:2387-3013(+)